RAQLRAHVIRFWSIALHRAVDADKVDGDRDHFTRSRRERTARRRDHQAEHQGRECTDNGRGNGDRGTRLIVEVVLWQTPRGKDAEKSAAEDSDEGNQTITEWIMRSFSARVK